MTRWLAVTLLSLFTVTAGAAYAAQQRELYRLNRSPLAHSKDIGHWRSSF